MNASVTFKDYNNKIKHIILLPHEIVSFGRDCQNDITLTLSPVENNVFRVATTDISRRHFIIKRKADCFTIKDCNSTNGTSLNCIALINKEKNYR